MSNRFLEHSTIAVSISDSPDLGFLGLGKRHLRDVMTEIARHLMAAGGSLIYGGDLRENGYTELLFEIAARYHKSADERPAFTNMLSWPNHVSIGAEEFANFARDLGEHAKLVRLARDGSDFTEGPPPAPVEPRPEDWAPALSAMRRRVAKDCQARIVLGGIVADYRGIMPGIAEEAFLSLQARQPVYLIGGFGGCAGDICEEMGLVETGRPRRQWEMRNRFTGAAEALHNGLNPAENRRLASTVHTDEIVALILRGLHQLADRKG